MSMSLWPLIHNEVLSPKAMVLGGGAFGTRWGHEGGAPMSEVSTLMKEAPESSLPPYAT